MRRDVELRTNLLGGAAFGHQFQDLALAGRERGDRIGRLRHAAFHVAQHLSCKRGRDERVALQRGMHRKEELGLCRVLEDIAAGAGFQRAARIRRLLVHREEDYPDVRIVVFELRERVDSIQVGHGDVGDDDVGPQSVCSLDQRSPIFDDRNELELLLEQTFQALSDQSMVVGKQNSRAFHEGPMLEAAERGTHADTVVPSPDLLVMLNRPPINLILSSIPA